VTAFVLLAAGIVIGRLWSRIADNQITDCPRCAIQSDEHQLLAMLAADTRQTEAQMQQATESVRQQPKTRHRRTDDVHQVDMFGGGR